MMLPAAAASAGEPSLFVPVWLWALTVGIVVVLITFEFVQATRNPHEVKVRGSGRPVGHLCGDRDRIRCLLRLVEC